MQTNCGRISRHHIIACYKIVTSYRALKYIFARLIISRTYPLNRAGHRLQHLSLPFTAGSGHSSLEHGSQAHIFAFFSRSVRHSNRSTVSILVRNASINKYYLNSTSSFHIIHGVFAVFTNIICKHVLYSHGPLINACHARRHPGWWPE